MKLKHKLIAFVVLIVSCILTIVIIYNPIKKADVVHNFTENIAFYINEDISVPTGEYLLYAASIIQSTEIDYGAGVWNDNVTLDDGSIISLEEYTKQQIVEQIRMTRLLCQKAESYGISLTDDENKSISVDAEDYFTSIAKYNVANAGIDLLTVLNVYQNNALAEKVYTNILNTTKKMEGVGEDVYGQEQLDYFTNEYKDICKELSPNWSYDDDANDTILSTLSLISSSAEEVENLE